MMNPRTAKASAAAIALFAFATTSAWSATGPEVTDALTKLIQNGNSAVKVTLGEPKVDGDAMVYSGVVVTAADGKGDTKIGTLTLVNPAVNAGGGIKADEITAENVEGTSDGTIMKIETIDVLNPDVTTPPSKDTEGKGKFDSFTMSNISVTEKDKPPVTIANFGVETADYVGDYPHSVSLDVENIVVDPAVADDGGQTAAQLKALGYDKLDISVYGSGAWDQDAGTLSLDELSIEGADAGAITLAGTLGGISADVMKMIGQPNPSPELLGKITLSEATLTYEDNSLANRVLDMQAKQMGQPKDAFVGQITAALPLMLSALQNPAFQDKLATAATAFLKDPKNLQITVQPDQPVPLAGLMGAAQTAPQTLPDMLKADVQANVELEE